MAVVEQAIIKHKSGLSNLARELGNVSQACRVMGVSRDTFYRYQQAVESGGLESQRIGDRPRFPVKERRALRGFLVSA